MALFLGRQTTRTRTQVKIRAAAAAAAHAENANAIINHRLSLWSEPRARGKITRKKNGDKLKKVIITPPCDDLGGRLFLHLRIGSVCLAAELTQAVSWVDDLPGIAVDPG